MKDYKCTDFGNFNDFEDHGEPDFKMCYLKTFIKIYIIQNDLKTCFVSKKCVKAVLINKVYFSNLYSTKLLQFCQ